MATHTLVEEFEYRPQTYSDAIEKLSRELELKCVDDLKALVRLRNLLIHRYWTIDDRLIYENVRRNFKCVEEFIKAIRERYGGN